MVLKGKIRTLAAVLVLLVMVLASVGYAALTQPAAAGPGQDGVYMRSLGQDGGIQEVVFFSQVARTPVGSGTPIASDTVCGLGEFDLHAAQVTLSGTLTGTNPTAAVKWQMSYDRGRTWQDVGTWTTINATVTPAAQYQTVSDIRNAATAVAYGDCWRATLTFGGTSPGGNIAVKGYNE